MIGESSQIEVIELLKRRHPDKRRLSLEAVNILSCLAFHSSRDEPLAVSQITECHAKNSGAIYPALEKLREMGVVDVSPLQHDGFRGPRYIASYMLIDAEVCAAVEVPQSCPLRNPVYNK